MHALEIKCPKCRRKPGYDCIYYRESRVRWQSPEPCYLPNGNSHKERVVAAQAITEYLEERGLVHIDQQAVEDENVS